MDGPGSAPQGGLQALCSKLVHPLLEVRRRTLQSLDFKLQHGLLTQEDLVQERSLLANVLGLLQFEDNGEQLDATALLLLQRIAGSFPAAARQLLQCGCEDQLRAARANRSPDIQQLIDATLSTLMSAPVSGPTTHAYDPTPTPLQLTGTAYTASQQYNTGVPVSQGSNMTQGQFGGIVRPLEHEFAGALGPRSVPSTPQHWRQSGSTRDTYTGLVSSIQGLPWDTAAPPSRPATASSVGSTRPQLTNAGRQQREQFAGSALARPPTAPGPDLPRRSHRRHTTEDAYRQQQVSYGQIVSQQQGFALGPHGGHMGSAAVAVVAAGQSLLDVAAQLPAKATDWLLQPVVLAPADEQRLFEQRMRLQHAQDPIHIALPALQDMLHGTAADLPAQALVVQPGLLDHILAMVSATSDASSPVQAPAANLLQRLFTRLKHALIVASDPTLACSQTSATSAADSSSGNTNEPAMAVEAGAGVAGAAAADWAARSGRRGRVDAASTALQAASGATQDSVPTDAAGSIGAGINGDDSGLLRYPLYLPTVPEYLTNGPNLQRYIQTHGLINVSALAHATAMQLVPLLASPSLHALVLPVLQELMQLLLVDSRGERAMPGCEVGRVRLALLLQPLSQALSACMAIARSESAALIQVYQDHSSEAQPPVLNLPAVHIMLLSTQLLLGFPADCWTPDLVPAALSEALSASLTDALCVAALPAGWAPAVRLVLQRLRPDVIQVLSVAEEGETAACAARTLQEQLPHLLSGTVAPREWLDTLQSALLALDLAPDDSTLLQTIVQGVAFVCSSASMEGPAVQRQAEALVLGLLTHALPTVQLATLMLLEDQVNKVRSDPESTLVGLLTRRRVCEQLATVGLSDPRQRPHAANILLLLLHRGEREVNTELLYWWSWITCYANDPHVSALACALDVVQQQHYNKEQHTNRLNVEWTQLEAPLLQLFSSKVDTRQSASTTVRDLLHAHLGLHVPVNDPQASDPFKAVLDGGVRDPLTIPTHTPHSNSGSSGAHDRTDPLARSGRGFRTQDVDNLLSILGNGALAADLRKSSAQQLLGLVSEACLCEHMSRPQALSTILEAVASYLPRDNKAPLSELLNHLDMALPVAAANLLYAVISRSAAARVWLTSHTGGSPTLLRTLPLIFHALLTVRHSMARLLAALTLGKQADKWEGWLTAVAAANTQDSAPDKASQGALLRLPRPFASGYTLPVRVLWVTVMTTDAPASPGTASIAQGVGSALVHGKPKLQELVASQRTRVALLVEERRLLSAAGGQLSQCAALLQSQPGSWRLSAAAAQCCCHNAAALSIKQQVDDALDSIRNAASHAQAQAALARLSMCTANDQGLAALSGSDWQSAFEHLLSHSPLSLEDKTLWLPLLALVQRWLASSSLSPPQLTHLALCLSQSILPMLAEPRAAAAPPPVPTALAGTLPTHDPNTGAPTNHLTQLTTLQVTQQALTVLVTLSKRVKTDLSVGQAARVVEALGVAQVLRVVVTAVVCGGQEVAYGCRVLGVCVLEEVLGVVSAGLAASRSSGQDTNFNLSSLEEVFTDCLVALLTRVCDPVGARSEGGLISGTHDNRQDNQDLPSYSRPRSVSAGGLPPVSHQPGQEGVFSGKALLRVSLACLKHLGRLLPVQLYAAAWQQESGIYWLTRLLRDRDVSLRIAALDQLTHLIQPRADPTQRLVALNWPDAASRLTRLAADDAAPYGVRAAALRFLCVALALPTTLPDLPPTTHTTTNTQDSEYSHLPTTDSITQQSNPQRKRFLLSPESLLKQTHFWDQLPLLVLDKAAPAGFVSAVCALLLQGLALDPEMFSAYVRYPGVFARVLGGMTAAGQAGLADATAGAGSTAAARLLPSHAATTGAGGVNNAVSTGIVTYQRELRSGSDTACDVADAASSFTLWPEATTQPMLSTTPGAQALPQAHNVPAPLQQQPNPPQGVMVRTDGVGSQSQSIWLIPCGSREPQATVPAQPEMQPQPQDSEGTHTGLGSGPLVCADAALQSEVLACCALAAQIVALCAMEEDTVRVGGLGQSTGGLFRMSVAALLRLGGKIVLIDRCLEAGTTADTTRAMRQGLACIHELLVLTGNLAHILSFGELLDAVLQAQSECQDPSPSLLVVLAEILTARAPAASTYLAAASLVATLLADPNTAAKLLVAPNRPTDGDSVSNHEESVCPSNGECVGAALCLALTSICSLDLLAPSEQAAADIAQDHTNKGLHGEALVYIVALRNTLAYSHSAKATALRVGLHTGLLATLTAANRWLEKESRKQRHRQTSAGGGAATHTSNTNTGFHNTPARTTATGSRPTSRRTTAESVSIRGSVAQSRVATHAAAKTATPTKPGITDQGVVRDGVDVDVGGGGVQGGGEMGDVCDVEAWVSPVASPVRGAGGASGALASGAVGHSSARALNEGGYLSAPVSPLGPTTAATTAHPRPSSFAHPKARVAPSAAHSTHASVATVKGSTADKHTIGCLLSTHAGLEVRVTVALSLFKHLVYHSSATKQTLLRSGVMDTLRQLWQMGLMPIGAAGGDAGRMASAGGGGDAAGSRRTSQQRGGDGSRGTGGGMAHTGGQSGAGAYFVASPALHEALGFVTNMLPECAEARAVLGRDGSPTMLQLVLSLLFECKLEASTWGLCSSLLSHLSAPSDGTLTLMRGAAPGSLGGEGFLGAAQSRVIDWLEAGTPVKPRDLPRLLSMIQVLTNIAAHTEGQKAILKSGGFARLMELTLCGPLAASDDDTAVTPVPTSKQWPQAVVQGLLLLLRNLCFSSEAKTHLLAHPKLLPCLMSQVDRVGETPQAATRAASALWALIYQGEKVKSALRRVTNAVPRLTTAHASAEYHTAKLAQASSTARTTDTFASLLPVWREAADTIQNVVQLMESTSSGRAAAAGKKAQDGVLVGVEERSDTGAGRGGRDQSGIAPSLC